MRIFNAAGSGAPVVLNTQEPMIHAVAWSPDGKQIATLDRDARIWNADGSGAPLVLENRGLYTKLAWSPDGKRIVTISPDGPARLWLVSNEGLLRALWTATSYCLGEERRKELLVESAAEAREGLARCRQEVARHGAGSATLLP